MSNKRTTIKDIALALGVSSATISIALTSSEGNGRVSAEMREKIFNTAKELNYRPNRIASGLRTGRSKVLGVIVSDITNAFVSSLTKAIQDYAELKGYLTIIANSNENVDRTKVIIDSMLNNQVEGLIIVPSEGSEKIINTLSEEKFPFVLLDRYYPFIKTSYVVTDNYKAASNVAMSLTQKGCKRLGFIGYKTTLSTALERKSGFADALRYSDLISDSLFYDVRYTNLEEDTIRVIDDIMAKDQLVDGLFFATNSIAFYGIKHLLRWKIKIPEDIKVGSFDNNDFYELTGLSVSYVLQPIEEMARLSVDNLTEQIETGDMVLLERKVEAEIIER